MSGERGVPPVTVETLAGQDAALGAMMGQLAAADAAGGLPDGWVRNDG